VYEALGKGLVGHLDPEFLRIMAGRSRRIGAGLEAAAAVYAEGAR
jgi:hypothetical protein